MSKKMELWEKVKQPPSRALRQIKGGRLDGKSDKKKRKFNKGWLNIVPKPLRIRWLAKVGPEDENGCWPWIGAKNKFGYGKIRRNHKDVGAHRVSYELNIGPIPENAHVLHKCDNPGCVNPDHLFLGDQAANNKDMFRKGRNRNQYDYNKNFKNGRAKPVEAFINGRWTRFSNQTEAAKVTGASISKISMASRNLRRKAGGLKWRRA